MGEQILAKLRDYELRRRREQIYLHEVEHSLNREENEQSKRYLVEEARIGRDERRVEQVPHDLWERQRDAGAQEQTHEGDKQSPQMRADSRKQPGERPGR
jgi:hypothetical protein